MKSVIVNIPAVRERGGKRKRKRVDTHRCRSGGAEATGMKGYLVQAPVLRTADG